MAQWEHGEIKPTQSVQERKSHCHTREMSSTHTVDASKLCFALPHQGQFYKDAFPYQLFLQGKKAF